MPKRVVATWEESITFLDQVVKERGLDLYHVFIHWHADPDTAHYCGVTYIDEKRMAFCQGNDKETMLHEIAHLQYKLQAHDEQWAERLIDLHHAYLSGERLEKANADLGRDYRSAAKVLKRYQPKKPRTRGKKS